MMAEQFNMNSGWALGHVSHSGNIYCIHSDLRLTAVFVVLNIRKREFIYLQSPVEFIITLNFSSGFFFFLSCAGT